MKKYSILLLFFAFFISSWGWHFSAFAQERAERHYDSYAYQDAIKHYHDLIDKDKHDGEALFKLANAYRLNGEFHKAEIWFAKAITEYPEPVAKLYYAQMLLSNRKYLDAEKWFEEYARSASTAQEARNAKKLAAYCAELYENGISYNPYHVVRGSFNDDEKLDFSPTYFSKNTIIFASTRTERRKSTRFLDKWTDEHYVDLFYVDRLEGDTFSEVKPFSESLNSRYHEGPLTISKDGKTIYFTRNDFTEGKRGYDENRNTRLHIYQSELVDGKWAEPTELPFNSEKYSDCHPALSPDGSFMILASDQPGGFGHMDLYISRKEGDSWTTPENLGSQINTAGSEVFPFIHPDGTLYFASNLHAGIGGLDIFKAKFDGRKWVEPENVGAPINSSRDDFGFILNEEKSEGYFTSNRTLKSDDIYYFKVDKEVEIEGTVSNCKNGEVIEGAVAYLINGDDTLSTTTNSYGKYYFKAEIEQEYQLYAQADSFYICDGCEGEKQLATFKIPAEGYFEVNMALCPGVPCDILTEGVIYNEECNRPLQGVEVMLVNLCNGNVQKMVTKPDGKYKFPVEKDCKYLLQANREGFVDEEKRFETKGMDCGQKKQYNIGEQAMYAGKVIELNNIYFDLDKYNIRPDAAIELDSIYNLLIEFPDMEGELSAHTDSRASFEYNETLSENRAKSAKQYLVDKGIDPKRLTYKGYGETKLRNECADDVPCTEQQHQRNRRVEFKVTYYNGVVLSNEPERFKEQQE